MSAAVNPIRMLYRGVVIIVPPSWFQFISRDCGTNKVCGMSSGKAPELFVSLEEEN